MKKSGSLFGGGGMQPCVYSQKAACMLASATGADNNGPGKGGHGWIRAGSDIRYTHNSEVAPRQQQISVAATLSGRPPTTAAAPWFERMSTLSFCYEFEHDDDTVFFSMCHPYTYTDLQDDIACLRADPERAKCCVFQTLCSTIADNRVDLITITSKRSSINAGTGADGAASQKQPRPAIILSGRVHPGETNASWMMRGCIDFLTGPTEEAEALRRAFIFKIVPMLNPDGVINGNYRCNLSGRDLNRRWGTPTRWEQPSIWHMREMIEKMNRNKRPVALFCDMHGHSRKKNVFIYGCLKKKGHPKRDLRPLEFPYLLDSICSPFSFLDSRFNIQRSKKQTGRIVGWSEFAISQSFTIEASFCGPSIGPDAGSQFRSIDLERIGREFCLTLYAYFGVEKMAVAAAAAAAARQDTVWHCDVAARCLCAIQREYKRASRGRHGDTKGCGGEERTSHR